MSPLAKTLNRSTQLRLQPAPPIRAAALPPPSFSLVSFATSLPAQSLPNSELTRDLGVSNEWILDRCGFLERAVASSETTSSLAVGAGRAALARADRAPDCLICATFTPDYLLCPTAPAIAHELGLGRIPAFDVNAACSGGLLGVLLGTDLLRAQSAQSVLVIASDTTSKFVRRDDAQCRILFGDGAAAFLLGTSGGVGFRILARIAGSDGAGASLFRVGYLGSSAGTGTGGIDMNGPAMFRSAVQTTAGIVTELCSSAQVSPDDIEAVILHQANARIIKAAAERTSIPAERWVVNSRTVGNLASASMLFAWAEQLRTATPRPGDKFILAAFGAGLTWTAILLECE